jgi:hypothetical protein
MIVLFMGNNAVIMPIGHYPQKYIPGCGLLEKHPIKGCFSLVVAIV